MTWWSFGIHRQKHLYAFVTISNVDHFKCNTAVGPNPVLRCQRCLVSGTYFVQRPHFVYIHTYRRIFLSLSSIYDGALFSDTSIMALFFLYTSGLVHYLESKQHLMIVPAISLLCACIPVSTKQNRISWWLCQAVNNMGTPHQDY